MPPRLLYERALAPLPAPPKALDPREELLREPELISRLPLLPPISREPVLGRDEEPPMSRLPVLGREDDPPMSRVPAEPALREPAASRVPT